MPKKLSDDDVDASLADLEQEALNENDEPQNEVTLKLYGQDVTIKKGKMPDDEWQKILDKAENARLREQELKQVNFSQQRADANPNQIISQPPPPRAASPLESQYPDRPVAQNATVGRAEQPPGFLDDVTETEGKYPAGLPTPVDRSGTKTEQVSRDPKRWDKIKKQAEAEGVKPVGLRGMINDAVNKTVLQAMQKDDFEKTPGVGVNDFTPEEIAKHKQIQQATAEPVSINDLLGGAKSPAEAVDKFTLAPIRVAGRLTAETVPFAGVGLRALDAIMSTPDSPSASPPAGPAPSSAPPVQSATVKLAGGGAPPSGMFPPQAASTNYDPQIQAALDQQKQAVNASAEAQIAKDQASGRVLDAQQKEIQTRQQQAQATSEFIQKRTTDLYTSTADAQKILNTPAETPNPERYWENHSKIMFAIGVGLMSAGKGDVGSLIGSVNQAIDRDIKAQQDKIDAPRKSAREQIAGNQNLIGILRNMGMDSYESLKVGEALSADFYVNQIKKVDAASNSAITKANAQGMIGELTQKALTAMQAAEQHRLSTSRSLAVEEENARTNRMKAQTDRMELQLKEGGQGGRKMTEQERKAALVGRQGISTIQEIRQQLGVPKGFIGSWKDSIKAKVPGSEMAGKQKAVKALNFKLATAISQSSLQAHEQKYWIGEDGNSGVLGNVGLANMTQTQLDALERDLQNSVYIAETRQLPPQQSQQPLSTERPR